MQSKSTSQKQQHSHKISGRPFELDKIFMRVTELDGIGPKNAALLNKLCDGERILDLLWHKPIDVIDRRYTPLVKDAEKGKVVTLTLSVTKHTRPPKRSLPYRVRCKDSTGQIDLVFFHANSSWIEKKLPLNETVVVSGKLDFYRGIPQIVHPDAIVSEEEKDQVMRLQPVYGLTAGLTNATVLKAIQASMAFIPKLPEWLDEKHKLSMGWSDWDDALKSLHNPHIEEELHSSAKHRARLAYDELLANQLALALVRHKQKKKKGNAFLIKREIREKVINMLPFELTQAQKNTLDEIDHDMSQPYKMLRLLQGDVGAGKTIVALLAMLNAISSGFQAAIMAPTEILARQHEESMKEWLDKAGISYIILTGRDKGKNRINKLNLIATGHAQIIIGTHALFQEDVIFNKLGMCVIDEQHRFGVHQRLSLASKGKGVDVLVMTATPIPRTLTLTAYGDMDVSRLNEKPPGRKPIDTRLISIDHLEDMIEGIQRQTEQGTKVYWVCPLVEESEKLDLAAAQERYEILQAKFGDRVGLVHGRMKSLDKDQIMQDFLSDKLDVLVATTVIEVGVNVPEATIMVIEHAERFGLAQLHQLRGRVGRGDKQSFCFLLYSSPLSQTAKERLKIMRDTEDGFIIAEKDLELRGAGDILGIKQSGLPNFKLADLPAHGDLLMTARQDVKLILEKDPELMSDRGQALKTLLYLFEKDQTIQYFRSG
jgi:ATP-dependent DNA helicase RecG